MASPQPLIAHPGGLWSLWDFMLEFDTHEFIGLMNVLRTITLQSGQPVPENTLAQMRSSWQALLDPYVKMLGDMRLPASRAALRDVQSWVVNYGPYNELAGEKVGFLCRTLRFETEGRKFLQIEHEDLYSQGSGLFGADVATKFSSTAAYEIDESGKCLAVGRSTAAVFHLMRVMEVGVKAASTALGIPDPVKDAERNWGVMLRKIKDEIDRRNKATPSGWTIPDDKNFFSEIYVSLDAVRNVWRNATMHVENKYTHEEAEHILGAVRGFLRKLAARCDERGQPLA